MTRFLRYFCRRQNDKGVNLIEMALVLGIIGLVIGGIFAAWGAVAVNNKLRAAGDMVTIIVQQIRATYGNRNSMESATPTVFTSALMDAELLPKSWRTDSGSLQNPWAGTVLIGPETYSGGAVMDGINISFTSVPKTSCYKFVNNMLNVARGQGLFRVDGTDVTATTKFADIKGSVCNGANGALTLHFTLKSQN